MLGGAATGFCALRLRFRWPNQVGANGNHLNPPAFGDEFRDRPHLGEVVGAKSHPATASVGEVEESAVGGVVPAIQKIELVHRTRRAAGDEHRAPKPRKSILHRYADVQRRAACANKRLRLLNKVSGSCHATPNRLLTSHVSANSLALEGSLFTRLTCRALWCLCQYHRYLLRERSKKLSSPDPTQSPACSFGRRRPTGASSGCALPGRR